MILETSGYDLKLKNEWKKPGLRISNGTKNTQIIYKQG